MNIELIWSTLHTTMMQMERGEGDWGNHLETARTAIALLMEFPTPEIVEQVKRSNLPTTGVLRWLAHEAGQQGVIDEEKLNGLKEGLEQVEL